MTTQRANPFGRRSFLKMAGVAAGAALVTGCGAAIPDSKAQAASTSTDHADMNTSSSTGTPSTTAAAVAVKPFKVYDAIVPAVDANPVKQIAWDSSDETMYIAKDVAFSGWTFGGTVPGPLLVVNEGDEVQFSITNKGAAAHSIDFHAAQTTSP